jgi:hypothetical protein
MTTLEIAFEILFAITFGALCYWKVAREERREEE